MILYYNIEDVFDNILLMSKLVQVQMIQLMFLHYTKLKNIIFNISRKSFYNEFLVSLLPQSIGRRVSTDIN